MGVVVQHLQAHDFYRTRIAVDVDALEVKLQLVDVEAYWSLTTSFALRSPPSLFSTIFMLKAQLAQSASLNANLLHGNKATESYLFDPQEARLHDLDSILHLALNGLQLLLSTSGSKQLRQLKNSLFAPSAKFTDRTKLSAQDNTVLDGQIENLLFHISPFLTDQAASRIIEWLIRRYRHVRLKHFLIYLNFP